MHAVLYIPVQPCRCPEFSYVLSTPGNVTTAAAHRQELRIVRIHQTPAFTARSTTLRCPSHGRLRPSIAQSLEPTLYRPKLSLYTSRDMSSWDGVGTLLYDMNALLWPSIQQQSQRHGVMQKYAPAKIPVNSGKSWQSLPIRRDLCRSN